jgi:hypothetical protein
MIMMLYVLNIHYNKLIKYQLLMYNALKILLILKLLYPIKINSTLLH